MFLLADTSRFGGISDHSGVWAKPALNPKSYRGEAMPKPRQSPAPQIASGVRFMAIITKPRVRVRLYGLLEVLEPLPLEKKRMARSFWTGPTRITPSLKRRKSTTETSMHPCRAQRLRFRAYTAQAHYLRPLAAFGEALKQRGPGNARCHGSRAPRAGGPSPLGVWQGSPGFRGLP